MVATENITQDAHFRKVHRTGSSNNKKQHAIRRESIHICLDDGQLRLFQTAGVRSELRDKLIASRNGKPPWLTNAFVPTVRDIEYPDVVSSGIFAHEFRDKRTWKWTKQALKTWEEATESYMVEVIPGSHFRSSN